MSWLVNSIANSLKLDDDNDEESEGDSASSTRTPASASTSASITNAASNRSSPDDRSKPLYPQINESLSSFPPRRGVKDDLSELSKTLTRQFWGVASFLAPPPPATSDRGPDDVLRLEEDDQSSLDCAESAGISGIRSDLSEIGGRFRTGIAKLSSNKAVSEFTKIASNFLQLGSEEDEESLEVDDYGRPDGVVVGVTDDVVAFARDVSMHPETWLDFPLPDGQEEEEDFDMTEAQQEHALAVERLTPSLAALRIELCPGYMSEDTFWKIYFVLVHPRLSKEDSLLLSTPQIMEARAMLMQELQHCVKSRPDNSMAGNVPIDTTSSRHEESHSISPSDNAEVVPIELSGFDSVTSSVPSNLEVDKHTVTSTEVLIMDKAVVKECPINLSSNYSSKGFNQKYDDDGDDWLKEQNSEIVSVSGTGFPIVDDDDDVSFSDLEEEEDDTPLSYGRVADAKKRGGKLGNLEQQAS